MKDARETARLAVLMAALVGLSGCAVVQNTAVRLGLQEARVAEPMPGQLETVHAAAIVHDEAVFWVASNGCTSKADLTPVVRSRGNGAVVTLRRIRADECLEPAPEGVEVRWTFEELGLPDGARLSIENPYQMPNTTGV